MYLSEIRIENFRLFGDGEDALVLLLKPVPSLYLCKFKNLQ